MSAKDRVDPTVGETRRQLALQVRSERPHAYRVGDLGGPLVMAVLWWVMPFEATTTVRIVGAVLLLLIGPVDQYCRHRLPAAWSNYALLLLRWAVASIFALLLPIMWVPAAIVLAAITTGSTAVESSNRVGLLGLLSFASLTVAALVGDVERWYLGLSTLVIVVSAHWMWHREWRSERAEMDRRHDEMVDRALMFSWEVDIATGEILSLVGNIEAVLGYSADELLGTPVSNIVDTESMRQALRGASQRTPDEEVHSIVTARHRDGRSVTLREVRLASLKEGVIRGVSMDITELNEANEALRYQAEHDALTGLANRTVVEKTVAAALRDGNDVVLAMADLDRFKEINDTLGHPAGDRLLRVLANRLREGLGDLDVVARLGGDEFAFVWVGGTAPDRAQVLGTRIHDLATEPIEVDGLQLAVACSVGVVYSPEHGNSYPDLLKHADIATYQAKHAGGGVVIFESAPDDLSVRRLQLISETSGALDRGEFELHFQPQVDLTTGAILGAEGLARWRHPEYGLLFPGSFFNAIEVGADYQRFNSAMLRQAIEFAADARGAGHEIQVAVNLGSMSFLDRNLPDEVESLLEWYDVPGSAITLEVVETDLLDEQRGAAVFGELARIGVRLSIDDFGTGYSTFTRLRALDVDEVKIDRGFVQGLGDSSEDAIIVRATIELAQLLGHDVVAEGVETVEQMQWLQRMGCDAAQGFLWSRAIPKAELLELLDEQTRYDVGDMPADEDAYVLDAVMRGGLLRRSDDDDIRAALDQLFDDVEQREGRHAVAVKDLAGRLVTANGIFRRALGSEIFDDLRGRRDEDFVTSGAGATTFAGSGFEVRDHQLTGPRTATATVQLGSGLMSFQRHERPLVDAQGHTLGSVFVLIAD